MIPSDGVGLKKTEILRSRNLFRRISLEGGRIDADLVRCAFLVHNDCGMPLQVGFKVSSRTYNAVQRNKVKRLMRAGTISERNAIDDALQRTGCCVGIVFFYKGRKEVSVGRLKLADIQKDLQFLCRTIANAL